MLQLPFWIIDIIEIKQNKPDSEQVHKESILAISSLRFGSAGTTKYTLWLNNL
jgi:hypothetical protein